MLRPERRHHGHGDTRCWDECSQRPSNHLAFSLHHGADPDRFAERAAIWEQDLATGGRRADASGLRNPNAVSVGQHGLWRPRPHSGYRVNFVPFEGVLPTGGPPLDVLTGFLDEEGRAYGRPVGVAIDRQGALLVADDVGNVVWRVTAAGRTARPR